MTGCREDKGKRVKETVILSSLERGMRTCVELYRSNVPDPLASHDGQSSCTRFSDRRDIPTRKPVQGSTGR